MSYGGALPASTIEQLAMVENILIARATGAWPDNNVANNVDANVRRVLMAGSAIKDLLPRCSSKISAPRAARGPASGPPTQSPFRLTGARRSPRLPSHPLNRLFRFAISLLNLRAIACVFYLALSVFKDQFCVR